jgi:2-amino-4-hydroxy-6-hydroxymethyldihydropteridine diphosphokinase
LTLRQSGVVIRAVSRFFRTPCFPPGAGPDFVNAVIAIRADAPPDRLMAQLHAVEARFGRERRERWAPRPLDLDLIACADTVLPDAATQARWRELSPERQRRVAPDRLVLPHPRMQDRAFVLVPMADIAPDWRHPLIGHTVRDMMDALPSADLVEVRPL